MDGVIAISSFRDKARIRATPNLDGDCAHQILAMPLATGSAHCRARLQRNLIESVRLQGLEELVAKRLDSTYEAGQRSGTWQKMRVNRGQAFVIGGYTPSGANFDAFDLRLLSRRSAYVCSANAQWLYARFEGATVSSLSRPGDSNLSIPQSARGQKRTLGRGAHCRQDEGRSIQRKITDHSSDPHCPRRSCVFLCGTVTPFRQV